jgi:hypothetical protein
MNNMRKIVKNIVFVCIIGLLVPLALTGCAAVAGQSWDNADEVASLSDKITVLHKLEPSILSIVAAANGGYPENGTTGDTPQPDPYDDPYAKDLPDTEELRIGVTNPGFDDIGWILRHFGAGVEFFNLTRSDLNNLEGLSQFYAIFINCGGHDLVNPRVLRDFVYQGGVVYASDHAGGPLSEAFPGIFSYITQESQTVRRADIVHSTLASHMGTTHLDVIFDMGGWYAITYLDENATVYIRGSVLGLGMTPLAFSFNHGLGTVFYTSFHNSAQATLDMIDFIEYLVFRIKLIEIDREMAARAEREGFRYRGQVFGMTAPGVASEPFFYTFDQDEFMLMLDGAQGNFVLTLTDPYGNIFKIDQLGEIVQFVPTPGAPPPPSGMRFEPMEGGGIRIIGGPTGEWSFTITTDASDLDAEAVAPTPFAIGIGTPSE